MIRMTLIVMSLILASANLRAETVIAAAVLDEIQISFFDNNPDDDISPGFVWNPALLTGSRTSAETSFDGRYKSWILEGGGIKPLNYSSETVRGTQAFDIAPGKISNELHFSGEFEKRFWVKTFAEYDTNSLQLPADAAITLSPGTGVTLSARASVRATSQCLGPCIPTAVAQIGLRGNSGFQSRSDSLTPGFGGTPTTGGERLLSVTYANDTLVNQHADFWLHTKTDVVAGAIPEPQASYLLVGGLVVCSIIRAKRKYLL